MTRWTLALLLAAALAPGCAGKGDAATKGPGAGGRKAPLVTVAPAARADAVLDRSYLVTLQPAEQAAVVSRASGYVLSLYADRGDRVAKGARLAAVEREELSAQQRQASAQVEAARASLENARENAARVERLAGQSYVSQQDADQARTAVRVAEAQLAAAEASLRATATRSGYAEVTAPFDGYVLKRHVDVGALAGPTAPPLFTLGSLGRVKAVAALPQADALLISVGQPATLALDGLPGRTFPGRITRFPPALDVATRTVDVELEFDNPGEVLRPGMFGRATLVLERLEGVLLVPPRAVARRDHEGTAFVVREGRAARVTLALGRTMPDGRVEVLSGLAEGDLLVVAGRDLVRDGIEVRTVAAKE